MKSFMDSGSCIKFERSIDDFSLGLFGFRPNLTLHFGRSALTHSYGYDSAPDRPNCLTSFALKTEPFMQYAG